MVGRALLRAIDAAKEVGYLKNIPELLSLKDFNLIPRSNVLIISTGSQGEPNSALSRISKDNDKFIKLIKKTNTKIQHDVTLVSKWGPETR